ncbi:serine/threonine-protein phosphatase CPPED1-like [Diadema setosum]|uniref:serine/threonine-protein phosphatase CPPED1-like n=1 Tax=Diadema setosum TaxID=31175 RepID=UPI003B3AA7DF
MTEFKIEARDRQFYGFPGDEEKWKGPFFFIVGADPQMGMLDTMDKKKPVGWEREIQLVRKAIEAVNAMRPRPKFFLMCGDLVQNVPGEEGREGQEKDFIAEFSKLDSEIPLVLVSGNHDVGRIPDRESIKVFTDKFGDDYFGFWAGGVRFLVLNSQLYDNDSKAKDVREEHDAWLENQLKAMKESGCLHGIVCQHIPWFLETAHEDKLYFNIERDFRLAMLDKFDDAGVKAVFSGHYHQNAGGVYKGVEQIVTSSMGWQQREDDKPGIRVVKVTEEGIFHQYYEMDHIPSTVEV